MNITDFRHLPFGRIPDEVVDACARAAADEVWRKHDEPLTERDWANVKALGAYHGRVKREHARARREWLDSRPKPAPGQVIIDAISGADVIETGDCYGYEWVADAPKLIEAALREAGWKLTPL